MKMFSSLQAIKRLSHILSWIPPPNVTGKLHLVAWDTTLARYHPSNACKVLIPFWLPGMDHGDWVTPAKAERALAWWGHYPLRPLAVKNSSIRFKEINMPLPSRNNGARWALCDYSWAFHSDEGLSKFARSLWTFTRKALDLPKSFIINWDPAVAQPFLISKLFTRCRGALQHKKLHVEDGSRAWSSNNTSWDYVWGYVVVVNPNDDRYKDLIGQNVIFRHLWTSQSQS